MLDVRIEQSAGPGLELPTLFLTSGSNVEDAIELSHRQLEHPGTKVPVALHKQGNTNDVRYAALSDFYSEVCVPCIQGKLVTASFSMLKNEQTRKLKSVYTAFKGRFERTYLLVIGMATTASDRPSR